MGQCAQRAVHRPERVEEGTPGTNELVEFTKTGQFVTELSVDPNNGGAFGLAIGVRNGVTTLAAVDDNTVQLKFYSLLARA